MQATISKIKNLTSINCHTEAAIELAKFIGNAEVKQTLMDIKKQRDSDGSITLENSRRRYSLVNQLLQEIKNAHGEETFKSFYSAI